jgi:nucleoside-diphosphate kinase
MKQKTFLMFKPDAYRDDLVDIIKEELKRHGLVIEKYITLDVDMEIMKTLLEHYRLNIEDMDPEFNFVGKMFNSFYYFGPKKIGPMVISFEGDEDITVYTRRLIGKTSPELADKDSIRGKYSTDGYQQAGAENRLVSNLLHASDSMESALRELNIWSKYFTKE